MKPSSGYKEVYERSATMELLRETGKFLTLDTKILSGLSRVAKGDLARQIINYNESEATANRAVRGRQLLLMFEHYCAWVQFWGPQSDSETGTRTREPNLVTGMGAQSSPTSDLNDWGRQCGSPNVEFLWLQNSARSAARKLVTLLLLALRKRSQKRSRKSYASLANPVPCSCPNVPAARLD